MNELQVFKNESFGEIRTVLKDSDVWFVAKDVCNILELSNVSMSLERLTEKQKGVNSIYTLGGKQNLSLINESGLYKLVFTSRKKESRVDFSTIVARLDKELEENKKERKILIEHNKQLEEKVE